MLPSGPRAEASLRRLRGGNRGWAAFGLSAEGCYQAPPLTARAANWALARIAGARYASKPFDESRVCQGFATFQPCFGGFTVSRAYAGIGAPCRPSLSSTTIAIS